MNIKYKSYLIFNNHNIKGINSQWKIWNKDSTWLTSTIKKALYWFIRIIYKGYCL